MFNGGFRSGFDRGYSFGNNFNGNNLLAPKNPPSIVKNGSQGTFNNNSRDLVCQICLKLGHTANICWHRFVKDYVSIPRGFGIGKAPIAAYLSNFDGFVSNPNFDCYENFNYMPLAYNSMSGSSYYSGIYAYTHGAAFMANFEGAADDGWYLDSGATHHLTNNIENLQISEEFKGTDQLVISNGQGLSITHIGHAFLSHRSSNFLSTHTKIALKDILLVPSITKNLLSISKLTSDNPITVEFCGNVCFVKDINGQILLQGLAERSLYKLLLSSNSSFPLSTSHLYHTQLNKRVSMLSSFQNFDSFTKACYHSVSNKCKAKFDAITLLHRKFGHPSSVKLMHFLKSCKHLKVSKKDVVSLTNSLCEACQLGKVHKQNFLATETKIKGVLKLIHTDIWGLLPTVSRNGYKYYISFVDDYIRYTWIYPLKLKSQAFEVFKLFKAQVEN